MINSTYNGQFVDGNQNILSGKSELQTALDSVQGGGGGGVQNPLVSNIDAVSTFTMVNTRDPIALGDVVNLNYFNTHSGGTPSLIQNNVNLNSKLIANPTEVLNGSTPLNMNTNLIRNVLNPLLNQDVATKNYVDNSISGISQSSIQNVAPNSGFSKVNCVNENIINLNIANATMLSLDTAGNSLAGNLNMTGFNVSNLGVPSVNSDATTKLYVDTGLGTKYPNTTTLNNITLASGDVNANTHKITNVVDPTGLQDASTKAYTDTKQTQAQADLRYYLNTVPLQSITLASGDVSINTNKITNVVDPTSLQDASTKSYTDTQVATKQSESQADLRYYLNTTPLNSITIPTANVSLNSQKIVSLQAGSTTTDAYQYGQAQTALALKSDRTQSLQSLNLQTSLTSNLDLNTGFKTLVKTADETNVKEVINKEYFDAHLFQTEHLYWISNNVVPVTATQVTGFVVKEQQPTSGSVNIVTGVNQVTLKGGLAYNIFVRPFFTGNNNNSNIRIQLWSGGIILDSSYPSAVELNAFPPSSNSQQLQFNPINYTFKPAVDTTIILQCVTATGLIAPCDIEWSVRQMPINYTVISQVAQTTPNESLQLYGLVTNSTVNANYTDTQWTIRKNNISTNIQYNNGIITLQANVIYQIALNVQFVNVVQGFTQVYHLYDTVLNQPLFTTLGIPTDNGELYASTFGNNPNGGHHEILRIIKPTTNITFAFRCKTDTSGGNNLRGNQSLNITTLQPFSSAVNTSSNLTINSDINMGATYKMLQQTVPTGPYDLINKTYGDGTYLQTNATLNQIAVPNASVSMNNQKITNLSPATLASDAVRFDQLSAGAVQNPMINALNAGGFKISNMGNGTLSGDSVNLGQSQAFNNGYLSKQIYNPLNSTDKLWFSNSKLIWEDSVQNTSTNPYLFFTKNGTSTMFIPDSSFLQDGAIEFQSDNINTPVLTLNKTQAKSIFSNYPVEIRNNTTQVVNATGLLNVGLPYTNVYSIVSQGAISASAFVVPVPCSKEWKDNIQEQTGLEWVDNMKIYSFDYSDEKLKNAGIDPICLQQKHIENGYLMEEIDPKYYLKTSPDCSWGGNDIINRPVIDQLVISRCHQRIQQQQQQINDLLIRVSALEQTTHLQTQVQSLNMNPFVVDQLSSDDEQQPVILDPVDIPKQKSSLFKSIF